MDQAPRLPLGDNVRKQCYDAKLWAGEEARARAEHREKDQCPCLLYIDGGPRSYMKRRSIHRHLETWGRHEAHRGPTEVRFCFFEFSASAARLYTMLNETSNKRSNS
jgi:hypothetical protein